MYFSPLAKTCLKAAAFRPKREIDMRLRVSQPHVHKRHVVRENKSTPRERPEPAEWVRDAGCAATLDAVTVVAANSIKGNTAADWKNIESAAKVLGVGKLGDFFSQLYV
jgi:hypothetical protein